MTPIINIVKKLMKPKVAKRINVYSNFEELYQLFPRSIFPKEYGGDEISCGEIAGSVVSMVNNVIFLMIIFTSVYQNNTSHIP